MNSVVTAVSYEHLTVDEKNIRLENLLAKAKYTPEPVNFNPYLEVYRHSANHPTFFIWDTKNNSIIYGHCNGDLTESQLRDIYFAYNPSPRTILYDVLHFRNPNRMHSERRSLVKNCCADEITLDKAIEHFRDIDH